MEHKIEERRCKEKKLEKSYYMNCIIYIGDKQNTERKKKKRSSLIIFIQKCKIIQAISLIRNDLESRVELLF